MKKFFNLTVCLLALMHAGCTSPLQDSEPEDAQGLTPKNVIITARFKGAETRVNYFEQQTTDEHNNPMRLIHQQWEEDDVLYGWDDAGNVLNLVVDYVEDGVAYLSVAKGQLPASGSIHMVYCGYGDPEYGNYVSSLDDPEDAWIDFSFSDGDYSSDICYDWDDPEYNGVFGVMSADAELEKWYDEDDNLVVGVDFEFENQTALIGLQGLSGLDAVSGVSISRIVLSGVRAAAVITLVDDEDNPGQKKLDFSFPQEADEQVAIECWLEPDANGRILFPQDNPFLIAVFPRDNGQNGGTDTEDIVLNAFFYTDEELEEGYSFTKNLGPREIKAGNYYYIPTRSMVAPTIPVVALQRPGFADQDCTSLEEACSYLNTPGFLEEGGEATLVLQRDCSVNDPLLFDATVEGQFISLDLNNRTLSLQNGAYLEAQGPMSFWIFGGTIVQSSDAPVLSSAAEFVSFNDVVMHCEYENNTEAPIQLSGTGDVAIWGGRYAWSAGSLIEYESSAYAEITGGRFSKDPEVDPWSGYVLCWDDDPARVDPYEDEQPPCCPYLCLPESVYQNVAHTEDADGLRILKYVSLPYGRKAYLALNNLYMDQEGYYGFENPNWIGNPVLSAEHVNYFPQDLDDSFMIGDDLFSGLYGSYWSDLWDNEDRCSLRFMKCRVQDAAEAYWNNIVIFPDVFEWPSGISVADNQLNNKALPWVPADPDAIAAPVFTISQAEDLQNAGCVFLPAAGRKATVEGEDRIFDYNDKGFYWPASNSGLYLYFDETTLQIHSRDGIYYDSLPVRLYYPCF